MPFTRWGPASNSAHVHGLHHPVACSSREGNHADGHVRCGVPQDVSKLSVYEGIAKALEGYVAGRIEPQHFNRLLEQLQVLLEAETAAQSPSAQSRGVPARVQGKGSLGLGRGCTSPGRIWVCRAAGGGCRQTRRPFSLVPECMPQGQGKPSLTMTSSLAGRHGLCTW